MKYDNNLWNRLLEKTEKQGDCIVYTGCKTPLGYGRFNGEYTHRISFIINNNRKYIQKGWCVCHTCDNPSCINPGHLYLGTQKQNIADAINKGRFKQYCKKGESRFGDKCQINKRKFTDEQVRIVRDKSYTYSKLKEMFGINAGIVYRIRYGLSYKNVK